MPPIKFPPIHLAALIAISGLIFFAFLGARDLWDIDEGMHAAIAQTMVLSGDWVTPMFNGEAFLDKPALFNWLNALSFLIFGFSEFAARVPAALAGLGCVMLTWQLGRKMYGESVGFLAGLVLATSLGFIIVSRVVQYDIPFTFFTTLALFSFASGVLDERYRRRYFFMFYMAVGLAILTKGLLGLVLPGMVIGLYLLLTRRMGLVREMQILPGVIIVLVIVTPWFVLMERANEGYLKYFIVTQHFGNFIGGEGITKPRHVEPFYYYFHVLVGGLLLWSAVLPQAVLRAWRLDHERVKGLSLFLIIWIVSIFVFFSAATSKLSTYLLPVFPAAALLIGRYLSEFLRTPTTLGRRGLIIGIVCWLIPIAIFSVYAISSGPPENWSNSAGIVWRELEIFTGLFSILIFTTLALIVLRKYRAAIGSLAATSPVLIFFVIFSMVPDANPYKGAKEISLQLDSMLDDGEKMIMYGQLLDSGHFYTRRNSSMLWSHGQLKQFFDSPDQRYALVQSHILSENDIVANNFKVIVEVANKMIVSNQAAAQQ